MFLLKLAENIRTRHFSRLIQPTCCFFATVRLSDASRLSKAAERKVGARGMMMIVEEVLLDAMYPLPSQKRIKEFVISSEMVERRRAIPGEGLSGVDGAAA